MFHVHGWVEILKTTDGDEDRRELEAVVDHFRGVAQELGLADRVDIVGVGGSYILRLTLVQNRDRGDLDRCRELVEDLAATAPGSYGVVYVRDDEQSGDMRRLVVRRGHAMLVADDVLSPLVPTIEDL